MGKGKGAINRKLGESVAVQLPWQWLGGEVAFELALGKGCGCIC